MSLITVPLKDKIIVDQTLNTSKSWLDFFTVLARFGKWTDYTPVVTLVGGAGNTVPVYTTNSAQYTKLNETSKFGVKGLRNDTTLNNWIWELWYMVASNWQ